MKHRSVIVLALLLVFAGAASAVDLKLPDKVTGDVGAFIKIPATTTGSVVKWTCIDKGLNLFPTDLLKDTKTAVVTAPAAGSFRVLAYTADAMGPSDPAITTVVVGTPTPPPPPPPPPPPTPTDAFFVALQAAYTADPDAAKATHKDNLAALYHMAPVNDPTLTTIGAFFAKMKDAESHLPDAGSFASERTAIAADLSKALPTNATQPLDPATRALIATECNKVYQYLEMLK